jgi:hypothetical protein
MSDWKPYTEIKRNLTPGASIDTPEVHDETKVDRHSPWQQAERPRLQSPLVASKSLCNHPSVLLYLDCREFFFLSKEHVSCGFF